MGSASSISQNNNEAKRKNAENDEADNAISAVERVTMEGSFIDKHVRESLKQNGGKPSRVTINEAKERVALLEMTGNKHAKLVTSSERPLMHRFSATEKNGNPNKSVTFSEKAWTPKFIANGQRPVVRMSDVEALAENLARVVAERVTTAGFAWARLPRIHRQATRR